MPKTTKMTKPDFELPLSCQVELTYEQMKAAIAEYVSKHYGVSVGWTSVKFDDSGGYVDVPPEEIRKRILEDDAEDFTEDLEELLDENSELYERLANESPLKIYHQEHSE